jgi:hypothetical protein
MQEMLHETLSSEMAEAQGGTLCDAGYGILKTESDDVSIAIGRLRRIAVSTGMSRPTSA